MVTSDDMESKIQEIERLVVEFMDEYPNGCSGTNCSNCALYCNNDAKDVRRYMCTLMHAKLFRVRD